MKFVKPSVEYIPQENGLDGMYKQIERCGRVCYKSEDKITDSSSKGFVERMIKSNHTAMLEHGTVYLAMPLETILPIEANGWGKYYHNPYSKSGVVCEVNGGKAVAVTTNYRVLVENGWLDDLQFLCEPTEYHTKRYTMKFITDRGVSHELVRHKVFSFAQESQRYCNYSKDKFNHKITFIEPSWNMLLSGVYNGIDEFDGDYFNHALRDTEKYYFKLLDLGWTPQQARSVLPNATKTEIVMTGFEDDWECFFDLRLRGTTGKPHPDMQHLAQLAWNEFKDKLNLEL